MRILFTGAVAMAVLATNGAAVRLSEAPAIEHVPGSAPPGDLAQTDTVTHSEADTNADTHVGVEGEAEVEGETEVDTEAEVETEAEAESEQGASGPRGQGIAPINVIDNSRG